MLIYILIVSVNASIFLIEVAITILGGRTMYYLKAAEMEVVKKLKETDSLTKPKSVLEEIRQTIVCRNVSYEIILADCLHWETIVSTLDPKYQIFKNDVPKLLESKSKDEQILLLTEMIMMF